MSKIPEIPSPHSLAIRIQETNIPGAPNYRQAKGCVSLAYVEVASALRKRIMLFDACMAGNSYDIIGYQLAIDGIEEAMKRTAE